MISRILREVLTSPETKRQIEKLAEDSMWLSIYIQKGESEYKKKLPDMGEDLDVEKIQTYINENYK